jgi:hypothetical protein
LNKRKKEKDGEDLLVAGESCCDLCTRGAMIYFVREGDDLFLNGIRMTYAKFINGRFMNLAYIIHMPFKNSVILVMSRGC